MFKAMRCSSIAYRSSTARLASPAVEQRFHSATPIEERSLVPAQEGPLRAVVCCASSSRTRRIDLRLLRCCRQTDRVAAQAAPMVRRPPDSLPVKGRVWVARVPGRRGPPVPAAAPRWWFDDCGHALQPCSSWSCPPSSTVRQRRHRRLYQVYPPLAIGGANANGACPRARPVSARRTSQRRPRHIAFFEYEVVASRRSSG